MDPVAVGKKRAPRFGCGNRLGKSRSEPFIVPCGVSYDSPSMNHPRRMLLLALPCAEVQRTCRWLFRYGPVHFSSLASLVSPSLFVAML